MEMEIAHDLLYTNSFVVVMVYSFPLRFVPMADPLIVHESSSGFWVRFHAFVMVEERMANVPSVQVIFTPSSTMENDTGASADVEVLVNVRVPSTLIPLTAKSCVAVTMEEPGRNRDIISLWTAVEI